MYLHWLRRRAEGGSGGRATGGGWMDSVAGQNVSDNALVEAREHKTEGRGRGIG